MQMYPNNADLSALEARLILEVQEEDKQNILIDILAVLSVSCRDLDSWILGDK